PFCYLSSCGTLVSGAALSCGTVVGSRVAFRPSTSDFVAFSSASVGFAFSCGVLIGPRLPERPINYNGNAKIVRLASRRPSDYKRRWMDWRRFLGELQRRNVYRVAVTYTVVSWVLIQIATQVFPFFEIPNW